ncbi:hypothetical protein [Rubritalea tangerina]|uniref:hypothetical protein n=1 Tax=Rubritalea tangerina TaxID=430798 RepID=UPI00360C42F7
MAVGFIRPHLPFGAPKKYRDLYTNTTLPPIPHPNKPSGRTTWHGSGEFMKYHRWNKDPRTDAQFADQLRLHYAACVSYIDAQIGQLMHSLDTLNLRDSTTIVLWATMAGILENTLSGQT